MTLRRVAIRVGPGEAETARARLLELAPAGFEEVAGEGWLELVAYADEGAERALRDAFGDVVVSDLEPGWEDAWRAFHRPVRVGGLWIGPPWEQRPDEGAVVVVDPGRAFGTGAHATTRVCIELLTRVAPGSVLDAGCGSGVVAAAAARLGHAPVYALDVDPAAVEAATGTARRNGLAIDVRAADVLEDELPQTDLVVANIELAVVERLLARRSARQAITAGYPVHERPRAPGWAAVDRVELDGWAADLFAAT